MMTAEFSRRDFLKATSAAAAGALIVGFSPRGVLASQPVEGGNFTPFIKIDSDGAVTAIIKHFEMGQGTTTGLATLIAEELGVNIDEVAVEFAPSDAARYANSFFGIQGTGGSTAIANSFMQYRQAGAAARQMLINVAALDWNTDPAILSISDGMVVGNGRSAPISQFVPEAASMAVPEQPRLKDLSEFKLIGNPSVARRDNEPKITGTAKFATDVQLDGQIVAVIKRSPRFGGKMASMDSSAASAVPGFINAVAMPMGAGIVVYAKDTWSAFRSRDAVTVEWDFSAAEKRSQNAINADMLKAVREAPEFVASAGADLAKTNRLLEGASQIIEAEFVLPYLSHAPMEPLTCTIEPVADGVILHDGCQMPTISQQAVAAVLELPPEKVGVNTLYAGGSFGRRATAAADYGVEAAIAFTLTDRDRPVKLAWSREDDITGGYYRPAAAHRVRAGIDDSGKIVAWDHRIASQSIIKGTPFEAVLVKDGVDGSSVEGVHDTPYEIPGLFVGLTDMQSPVTVLWWRSVGHSHTAFVMESMMDMAAKAAGRDPVAFRLDYLSGDTPDQRRLAGVLKLAAQESGWDSPVRQGRSRGVAVHKSFNSYVAEVVEVSRNDSGHVKVERVTCAVDCGIAVNPDIIKAQMEGGIGYGLGHVMRNEVTFDEGRVVQQNFPNYPPLRIADIGRIDVHIVPSTEAPTGVGEPGLPPAGPALANAIAVEGPRVTNLPMTQNGIRFA